MPTPRLEDCAVPVRIADILLAWRRPLAALLLATLIAAAAYVLVADDVYEADARVQVVPVSADDETFEGFSVLRESNDEETPAQTAADLVESSDVVDAVATRLTRDRDDLLDAVSADADGASNVVIVTARWSSPQAAAQIANAFAEEFVARRSSQFQADLERAIARLRDVPGGEARIETLEAYEGLPDPTVEVVSDAVAPESSVSPSPLVIIGGALLAALLLALAAASAVALAWRPATRATRPAEPVAAPVREPVPVRAVEPDPEPAPELEPEPQPERRAEPEPRPPPVPVPDDVGGAWTLPRLERLVAERGDEFPDRVEEWRAYLFFLRDHATPEGRLAPSFDALVAEVFEELL
jgi:capsular polysaccharide biosynthesis protein